MSYSVKLTDVVIRKFKGWRLSRHEIREILEGLDVLSFNPRNRLIRVGPPYDSLQYDLIVARSEAPRRDILYSFTVRYGADEQTLLVVDCEQLLEKTL